MYPTGSGLGKPDRAGRARKTRAKCSQRITAGGRNRGLSQADVRWLAHALAQAPSRCASSVKLSTTTSQSDSAARSFAWFGPYSVGRLT